MNQSLGLFTLLFDCTLYSYVEKAQGLHLGSLGCASKLTCKVDSDWPILKKALSLKALDTSFRYQSVPLLLAGLFFYSVDKC